MAEIAKADMTLFQNRFIGDGQAEQTATEITRTCFTVYTFSVCFVRSKNCKLLKTYILVYTDYLEKCLTGNI